MTRVDAILPDLNVLDVDALKALVIEKHTALISHRNEIENLQLLILKLKRMQFGTSSERLARHIDQLELQLEDLEILRASRPVPSVLESLVPLRKPARRPLPAALPRETETLEPEEKACPDCGGTLGKLGEDVSETLEYIPARFKVIRTVRPKLSCNRCDRIVQQPAPNRPIDRGLAGPALLAHVVVSKYADHLPLYRQSDIYEREGVELERSTLAGWVGGASRTLEPLVDAIRRYVVEAGKLHGDDTPVPVLAPGNGKTKTGRLWTYVRDDRPAGSTAAPAVWFAYSPDRKGEHPANHLAHFRGTLQADGFAGFNRLYETGLVIESACWAHVRRKFHDLFEAHASNNWQGGGSGGVEYGTDSWLFWGGGSGQRAGDYKTSLGTVPNSYTKEGSGSGGVGYYQGKGFFTADYTFDQRRYGIPFDSAETDPEKVFLNPRRHSVSFTSGVRDRDSFISGVQGSFQYNDYKHQEVNPDGDIVNTEFLNKTSNYRATFDMRRSGGWSGTFGLSGLHRNYSALGEEALAPPTGENDFSLFALEKMDMDHVSFQFGGRYDHNGYNPEDGVVSRATPDLSFNGLSASVGTRISTWKDGAFVAYYSHSYRAPTLEELYNEGPHGGNATFEIGDVNLTRELSDGIDISLRHSNSRVRAQFNYFYYHLKDFIFLAPTGTLDTDSGLEIANYTQGTSRYTGPEAKLDIALHHNVWLLTGLDYVDAKLTDTNTPLPRIPPLRGRIGFEWNYKTLRIAPEAVMSNKQDRVFSTESPTSGYTVFNLNCSYTFADQHSAQTLSVTAFNLSDRVYRNHMSFIKDFAPEIGRGVRLTYTVRFY